MAGARNPCPHRLAALLLLAAAGAAQEEGWITHRASVSRDLRVVARGSMHAEKGTAWLITCDAARNVERCRVPASGPIRDLSFSADGSRLAATDDHGKIRIHETRDLRLLREIEGHENWVLSVALSPDGKTVASGGRDGNLRIVDVDRGKEIWSARSDRMVTALAFLPDGKGLVAAQHAGPLRQWTLAGESVVIGTDVPAVEALDVSADGRSVASTHRNGELRLWDARERTLLWTAAAFEKRAYSVSFSPDGKRVAASGASGVRIFDRADGKAVATLRTERPMIAVRFGQDRVVAADYDGCARAWRRAESGWQEEAPRDVAEGGARDG